MRLRNQRGVAFPSPVAMLSVIAVAMAGIAYVATQGGEPTEREVTTVAQPSTKEPAADPVDRQKLPKSKQRPIKREVTRGDVYVEVYNNSGISGLAGRYAGTATDVGWQVVGSDNWYGTVPGSTVYFPARLESAAKLLGPRPRDQPGDARRPARCGSTGSPWSSPPTPPDLSPPDPWLGEGMEFTSAEAERRFAGLAAAASRTVVGLDFDGVLSPIVEDPSEAHIHPGARDVLVELAQVVRAVAVVTGRPARQALALGDLDEIGAEIGGHGKELFVFGQYGNERWSSTHRRVVSPRPPHGLSTFQRELPGVLRRATAGEAYVEEKGLAVAVHTRRLPDPVGTRDRLLGPLGDLAARHGLVLEPGRNVIEVRSPGMSKGNAVRTLVEEQDAGGFLFAGDDLGDLEAFAAVEQLREQGMPTLLVCSLSDEESALAARADVLVPGPDGVLELLRRLTREAG